MNTKQRTAMILVLFLSLAISSCAPGQLFSPTITPTPTLTFTPTVTPTLAPSATPTLKLTPTPTLTPTPSCTVQSGEWSGDFSEFTVDHCFITSAGFTIQGNGMTENVTLNNKSIPIVNNEFQYSFTTENTGASANSQSNMEFSGTFLSPTEFKGILQLPEGPVTIRASMPVPTATPAWFPPLTQWKEGIPIMSGAIDGITTGGVADLCEEDPHSVGASYCTEYDFHIKASAADIIAYYQQQMQTLGWKSGNGSGDLIFTNGDHTLTVSILPYGDGGDINEVKLSMH